MILVTGVTGQLGFDVVRELKYRNLDVIGTTRNEVDLTSEEGAKNFILAQKPTVVIHCAAYTAVDKAESEAELAFTVNGRASRWIAEACLEVGAKMIYISTDYVFGGEGNAPYEIDDEKNPTNVYGRSKLLGEESIRSILPKHFIVRVSWVFGINGKNFIKTMLQLGKTKKILNVVNDQIGSPTYTVDLAKLLVDMSTTEKFGTYHASNEGFCSWADFAKEIFLQAALPVEVNGIPTHEYPTPARRPLNSRLSKKSLGIAGFNRLPEWKDALKNFLKEL